MTQTLLEKLEALPRYNTDGYQDKNGSWIYEPELLSIIEEYKATAQAPIAWLCVWKATGASFTTKLKADMEHFKAHGYEVIPLFTHPQLSNETVKDAAILEYFLETCSEEVAFELSGNGEADASELKEAIRIKMQASIDEAMKAEREGKS